MVGHDSGLPDPPDSDDSLTTNTEIVMMNDSESDDDLNEYNGYEPLPLEDDQEVTMHEEQVIEDIPDAVSTALPELTRMEETLVQEVWSSTPTNVIDIRMDKEKEEEVKQAMLNFNLPASSIPAWANTVPEEEWKDHLMQILQGNKKGDASGIV